MKTWRVLCLVGVLAGCATEPYDYWSDIEVSQEQLAEPINLPQFPEPIGHTETEVCFDLQGARNLTDYKTSSEANEIIALEHTQALQACKNAGEALVRAGRAQHELTEIYRRILHEERKHWMYERTGYWALILGIGLATIQ